MMTREEARIELQAMKDTFEEYEPGGSRCQMALNVALTALRPVSREQVEKVWRGEWMQPIFGDQQDANDPRCQCSECGSIETPLARHRFCPSCGAPMTDEAVKMAMERINEMEGTENGLG